MHFTDRYQIPAFGFVLIGWIVINVFLGIGICEISEFLK